MLSRTPLTLFLLLSNGVSEAKASPATFLPVVISFDDVAATGQAKPLQQGLFSMSIEFCYASDFLGSPDAPNKLSLQLLQNIQDRTGAPPIIRLGGDTQDVTRYCETCIDPFTTTYAQGNTEAIDVAFNKEFFGVLNKNVPSNQRYIFGLNFKQNNLSRTSAEVHAAQQYLDPTRLISYELGNEVDIYNLWGSNARPDGWNVQIYVAQVVEWLTSINNAENGKLPGWQLGTFSTQPLYQGNFSLRGIIALDVLQKVENVISLSEHTYFSSICSPSQAAQVSLANLMNHTNIVGYFAQWLPEINATHSAGLPFVMGEAGSVSCHGKAGVSNTLGAALWSIDYALHGAVLGMDAVYFHQGTPFFYSMWQPVAYNNTPAVVYPTYYGMLFVAEVIGTLSNARIYSVGSTSNPNLAVYAIYAGSALKKIVALNMDLYDPSTSTARSGLKLDLSRIFGNAAVHVKRLTGPFSAAQSGVTMMGQSFDDGNASGIREVEEHRRLISIIATEAIIVEKV